MNSLFKLEFNDLFDREVINRGRQSELDVMKFILVFGMISCHVQEVMFSRVWEDFYYINITNGYQIYLIVFNAVVAFSFMFLMGASMQFSRNQDIKKMILRGLNLILSWFLLKVSYIYPLGVLFAKSFNLELVQFCIAYVFNSDILFFAGAFFIYYAILKKLKVSDLGLLLISLVLFTLGNIIYFKSDSILLENLIGEFVWTDETCFPFINWVMAPTLGVFFGKALIRCKNKNALYSYIGVFSALILFMIIKSMEMMDLLGVESINAYSEVDFFYHTNYLTLLFSIACLGVFMSLSYLLSKMLGRKLLNVAAFVSYHVNHIYIMQWVIIPWLALILPRQTEKVSPLLAFEITAVIFVFCTLVILLYQKVFKKAKK